MFTDFVYKWLDIALDYGIEEQQFWTMTIAELERAVASKRRVKQIEAKERASFDYILAELIGRSVARVFNSSNDMPTLNEAYPSLFDTVAAVEEREAKKAELSALRFKLFADKYNSKFKGVQKANE